MEVQSTQTHKQKPCQSDKYGIVQGPISFDDTWHVDDPMIIWCMIDEDIIETWYLECLNKQNCQFDVVPVGSMSQSRQIDDRDRHDVSV